MRTWKSACFTVLLAVACGSSDKKSRPAPETDAGSGGFAGSESGGAGGSGGHAGGGGAGAGGGGAANTGGTASGGSAGAMDAGTGGSTLDAGAGGAPDASVPSDAGRCLAPGLVDAGCSTLAQLGEAIIQTTTDAGAPATLAGGAIPDGVYVMTAMMKYASAGVETIRHTLRISACGTKFEFFETVGGSDFVLAGDSEIDPVLGTFHWTSRCSLTVDETFPYEWDGTTLRIVSGTTTRYLETYTKE
ncbi:MAG TPA: hypothetical protein VHE30_07160 [Polyangiaceae bacterium]|nr:hypothetical protein [Polyangiaceae bacterium]